MKSIKIFSILIFFSFSLQGQTIKYGYDAAGNRIKREIVLQEVSEDIYIRETVYSEMLEELIVRIYPNPTEGYLKVQIANLPEGENAKFCIFDLSGKLILQKEGITDYEELDISNQAAGTYLLKIYTKNNNTEWKIIKK